MSRRLLTALVVLLLLFGLSIVVLIPLVWTICMALKPDGEIYNGKFFPTTLQWSNFYKAVTSIDFFLSHAHAPSPSGRVAATFAAMSSAGCGLW